MATESPIRMLDSDESAKWLPTMDSALFSSPFGNLASNEAINNVFKESVVLEKQTRMVPNRSGSAPPTVEGSIAAFRAFIGQRNVTSTSSSNDFLDCESEEQMRTDPAYITYYYANIKMNPRLPPPIISRENHDFVRLMGAFSGRKVSPTEGLMATHKEEPEEAESLCKTSADQKESFVNDAKMTSLSCHSGSSVNLAEGEFIQAASSASSAAVNGENDEVFRKVSTTDQMLKVQDSCSVSVDACTLNSSTSFPTSTTNSCARNVELEDNASIQSNVGSDITVVESRMKLLDVSGELMREDDQNRRDSLPSLNNQHRFLFHPAQDVTYQPHGFQGYALPRGIYAIHQKLLPVHHQALMPNPGVIPPLIPSTAPYMNSGNLVYPHVPQSGFPSAQFGLSGYSLNPMIPPHYDKYIPDNAFPLPFDAYSQRSFLKQPMEALPGEVNPYTSQILRPPFGVPLQRQYFQPSFEDSQRTAQGQLAEIVSRRESDASSTIGRKELNLSTIEKPGISSTGGPQINVTYYGHPLSFGETRFAAHSPVLSGSVISRNIYQGVEIDPNASMNSQKSTVASLGLKGQKGPESSDNSKRHSFLELLKSSSSRTFGLSDISGQIVEFSTDQHGSRFIQQKLENCGSEEKESVFNEVLPQSSKLMTDVFGNYVVQKFFEHGTAEQRRKLGLQIEGQVLTLSLQMYGCRVIQKALEVIEFDQKVKLLQELDGHVMKCVHDQNGNHVIQKCIESVPTEKIKFIISSFAGQVATLSCHPYGCRVIQRALEHCSDEQINEWIVDEILESTSILAKDPYGNYVTQHILEMGKPNQRSQIIHKLKGQFVQLSQHKFASNVVEKCLKFGNASEQEFITEEIIAQSENNESLLTMMKDQFANYVVQRIFEIGSEKQKDTLRNYIRLHLPFLKKAPYAKHIVSRYEQLEGSTFGDCLSHKIVEVKVELQQALISRHCGGQGRGSFGMEKLVVASSMFMSVVYDESSEQEQIKQSTKMDDNILSISE